jgi:hypothetical protein
MPLLKLLKKGSKPMKSEPKKPIGYTTLETLIEDLGSMNELLKVLKLIAEDRAKKLSINDSSKEGYIRLVKHLELPLTITQTFWI